MSLIKREPSPAQASANRANSLHSTGPRSERGKAVSSRNLLNPRPFSEVVARSMEALGERRTRGGCVDAPNGLGGGWRHGVRGATKGMGMILCTEN
jgi:hypothetical protein